MKKINVLITFSILIAMLLCGCSDSDSGKGKEVKNPYDMFTFTHYSSGGATDEETAVILFEHPNSTFTSYQVAFVSCTCRDVSSSFYSVMYIELLNTKKTADEAAIRSISFGDNRALWGDSNPTYGTTDYTPEYFDEHFIQPMVGKTKADFDAWEGYKKPVGGMNVDAVSGASVSTSNIDSVIKSLFEYHANKYYKNTKSND